MRKSPNGPLNSNQTFLDFCRQQNIPFNQADQMSYKLLKNKELYQIFRVYFDAFVDNICPDNPRIPNQLNPQTIGPSNISIQPNPHVVGQRK
jgi:hypothetical protein